MMQTDILAKNLTASGVISSGPARLKAITITYTYSGTTPASVVITDGAGGRVIWQWSGPINNYAVHILLPGEGIRAYNSIYATLNAYCSITAVYG